MAAATLAQYASAKCCHQIKSIQLQIRKITNKRTMEQKPTYQGKKPFCELYLPFSCSENYKNKFWFFFFYFSKILSRKSVAFSTKHKHLTLIYPSKSGKKKTHSDTFPNSLDLIIVCPTLTWKIHIAIKYSPLLTFNRTGAIRASGFLVIFKFDRFLLTRSCHTCCAVFSFCRYVHVHSLFIFLLFK